MSLRGIEKLSKNLLFSIIFLTLIFCLVVFLDIPIIRQIFSFLYLTIIPGFIFVKLLNFERFDKLEILLFSVGFSIAFLMITGLLVNELGYLFGLAQPLSILPLMFVINIIVLIGGIVAYRKNKDFEIQNNETSNNSIISYVFLSLPILSIIGAMYVNSYNNNSILLFLMISIVILFTAGVFSKRFLTPKMYPLALFLIAISILYHSSLITNYIVPFGSDVPYEYYLFKTTQNNGYWDSALSYMTSSGLETYNNMISITILPTVYANLMNIDAQLMFKLIYPIIFSFLPVVLYSVWQKFVGQKYAFLASFLFMSQMTFYTEMLGLNRQIIGELFFALLLLVIVQTKMRPASKVICFTIFSFGLVASHYALSLIFFFFISFAFILLIVLKRPSKKITASMIVLFFVVMFSWYIYTSDSASFYTILGKADYVNSQLAGFFNLSSRGETVLAGLGLTQSPSIWNTLGRIFAYLTQGFILLGLIGLITNRKRFNIGKEYFIFAITAMAFLGMLIVVPGLANTLNMTRFYHILLFFLAPLCVIGAKFILSIFSKKEQKLAVCILMLLVLVPYFLFQTNFVYEVTDNDSWSIPLSGYRMDPLRLYGQYGYADDYSSYSAQWLVKNANFTNNYLYSDKRTQNNILTIHGLLYGNYTIPLTNTTTFAGNSYVYLSSLNVLYDLFPYYANVWNSSQLNYNFTDINLIYCNGGSSVYKNLP